MIDPTFVNELTDTLLDGRTDLALSACATDTELARSVGEAVATALTHRSAWSAVAVSHPQSHWIRAQVPVFRLATETAAAETTLANSLLAAITTEHVAGADNALEPAVAAWLIDQLPDRVLWHADPENDELEGGRFLFAALFALPGEQGARWLPALARMGGGVSARTKFAAMTASLTPTWSDTDWRLRFDALAAAAGERPKLLESLREENPPPSGVAVPLSRLATLYLEDESDPLLQTFTALFTRWRTGDPTHDLLLFDWRAQGAQQLNRLRWLIESTSTGDQTERLVRAAIERGLIDDGALAALLQPDVPEARVGPPPGWIDDPIERLVAAEPLLSHRTTMPPGGHIDDLGAFARALRGTVLEGLPLEIREIPGGGTSIAMAFPDGHDTTDVAANWLIWKAAVPLIERTGRYPLLTGYDSDSPFCSVESPTVHSAPILEVAERLWSTESRVREPTFVELETAYEFALQYTHELIGQAPSVAELKSQTPGDDRSVEQFLMRWEAERGAVSGRGLYATEGRLMWEAPNGYDEIHWLPTTRPEETAAYVFYYGGEYAGGGDTAHSLARFVTDLRSWHDRFGAMVVANGGLTLELWIPHPPRKLDAAFDFACELETWTQQLGPAREIARALRDRHTIHLFARP